MLLGNPYTMRKLRHGEEKNRTYQMSMDRSMKQLVGQQGIYCDTKEWPDINAVASRIPGQQKYSYALCPCHSTPSAPLLQNSLLHYFLNTGAAIQDS